MYESNLAHKTKEKKYYFSTINIILWQFEHKSPYKLYKCNLNNNTIIICLLIQTYD